VTPNKKSESEIRALLERHFDAARHADVATVVELFADDVVDFEQAAARLDGREAVHRYCQSGHDHLSGPFSFEVHDLAITAGDDPAFFHAFNHVRSQTKDSPPFDMWARWTGCLREIDGRWFIVHQHLSNPFDPMTMKADFNFGSSAPR
jgi:uncharacterized protein (TIGR02246 family)